MSLQVLLDQLVRLDEAGAWEGLEAQGYRRCAAFDADGTLWRHDITEALVKELLERRDVRLEALPIFNALLERYGQPPATDPSEAAIKFARAYNDGSIHVAGSALGMTRDQIDEHIWPSYNYMFAGWSLAELEAHTEKLLESGFVAKTFEGVPQLLEVLRRRGFRTVVVSAGIEPAVRIAAARLGFPPSEVWGMRSVVSAGRLTGEIEPPVLYGAGKVEAVRQLCGGRPLLAFGDSAAGSDRHLLEAAWLPVAVEPKRRHLEHAKTARWHILDFVKTIGGEESPGP